MDRMTGRNNKNGSENFQCEIHIAIDFMTYTKLKKKNLEKNKTIDKV